MKLLAISGSTRSNSTNTSLLRALSEVSPTNIRISMFEGLLEIPVFSPDSEGPRTPRAVQAFCEQLQRSDGVIIASPEYVRTIPGGLKNAIDWLVSREEVVYKPIVLAHASHRGDDMLQSLRLVLNTVTTRFDAKHFLRFSLASEVAERCQSYALRAREHSEDESIHR